VVSETNQLKLEVETGKKGGEPTKRQTVAAIGQNKTRLKSAD
jgi:hypothetical protein